MLQGVHGQAHLEHSKILDVLFILPQWHSPGHRLGVIPIHYGWVKPIPLESVLNCTYGQSHLDHFEVLGVFRVIPEGGRITGGGGAAYFGFPSAPGAAGGVLSPRFLMAMAAAAAAAAAQTIPRGVDGALCA